MLSRLKLLFGAALAFAVLASIEVPAAGADVANNSGMGIFVADRPTLFRKFPTLEAVVPVPSVADVSGPGVVRVSCRVRAESSGSPVKGARGDYRTELLVLDRGNGESEIFPLGSGVFRTRTNGTGRFVAEIPKAIFADGFESGNVAAWAYARADFRKRKGTLGVLDCDTTAMAP